MGSAPKHKFEFRIETSDIWKTLNPSTTELDSAIRVSTLRTRWARVDYTHATLYCSQSCSIEVAAFFNESHWTKFTGSKSSDGVYIVITRYVPRSRGRPEQPPARSLSPQPLHLLPAPPFPPQLHWSRVSAPTLNTVHVRDRAKRQQQQLLQARNEKHIYTK